MVDNGLGKYSCWFPELTQTKANKKSRANLRRGSTTGLVLSVEVVVAAVIIVTEQVTKSDGLTRLDQSTEQTPSLYSAMDHHCIHHCTHYCIPRCTCHCTHYSDTALITALITAFSTL